MRSKFSEATRSTQKRPFIQFAAISLGSSTSSSVRESTQQLLKLITMSITKHESMIVSEITYPITSLKAKGKANWSGIWMEFQIDSKMTKISHLILNAFLGFNKNLSHNFLVQATNRAQRLEFETTTPCSLSIFGSKVVFDLLRSSFYF